MSRARWFVFVSAVLLSLGASRAIAQEHMDATALAKQTQNPVADLTSIPFQFNWNTGGVYEDRAFYNMNFQPVFPMSVGKGAKLIARPIVPYLNIPTGTDERETGIGDIQLQLYFTGANPGATVLGLGPVFSFPTATNDLARSGEWAAGPGAVIVKTAGPWVLGGLANQLWSFSHDGQGEKINQTTIQPFINYNMGDGWALSTGPIITANWSAAEGEEWTVPLGAGITKTTMIGTRPTNLGIQYYNFVERPTGAAENQLRLVVGFLFPQKKG
ncbi:MAG: neuromedin U [Candidatus Eiseniibacteriota bacterium]